MRKKNNMLSYLLSIAFTALSLLTFPMYGAMMSHPREIMSATPSLAPVVSDEKLGKIQACINRMDISDAAQATCLLNALYAARAMRTDMGVEPMLEHFELGTMKFLLEALALCCDDALGKKLMQQALKQYIVLAAGNKIDLNTLDVMQEHKMFLNKYYFLTHGKFLTDESFHRGISIADLLASPRFSERVKQSLHFFGAIAGQYPPELRTVCKDSERVLVLPDLFLTNFDGIDELLARFGITKAAIVLIDVRNNRFKNMDFLAGFNHIKALCAIGNMFHIDDLKQLRIKCPQLQATDLMLQDPNANSNGSDPNANSNSSDPNANSNSSFIRSILDNHYVRVIGLCLLVTGVVVVAVYVVPSLATPLVVGRVLFIL